MNNPIDERIIEHSYFFVKILLLSFVKTNITLLLTQIRKI